MLIIIELEGHSVDRILPPTKLFRRLVVNKNILKRLAAATNTYNVGFPRRKIPRTTAYTLAEKAIRFRHPDYIIRIGLKS